MATCLLLSGCQEDLDLGEIPFRCGADGSGASVACPGGYECREGYCVRPGSALPSEVPVADAGPDQTVVAGDTVTLDGTGSKDPEGRALIFEWSQSEGTAVTLSDPASPEPSFAAPGSADTLVFSLVVSAEESASSPDAVTVTVLDEPPCGELPEGCALADLSSAEGDVQSGHVNATAGDLFASGAQGVEIAAVKNGCLMQTAMLTDPSFAQISQTFRVPPEEDGRALEIIEIGPLNWADTIGPGDATLTLTLMLPGGPVSATRPTSTLQGMAVSFDFSGHQVRLEGGELYEMRLSTDLPVGGAHRIAWLGVRYGFDHPDCRDRVNEDPETSMRYCSAEGACSEALHDMDAEHRVLAAPRAGILLCGDEPGELSSATIEADIIGGILFDLFVPSGGGWEAALVATTLQEIVAAGITADELWLEMSFVDRPSRLSCLRSCLASTLPVAEILSAPPDPTRETTAGFDLGCDAGEPCDFECALDGAAFEPCPSSLDLYDLEDGPHVLAARASLAGEGRFGPAAEHSWTIDSVPPLTYFTSKPDDPTYETEAVFEFACDKEPCDFDCSHDGEAFEPCTSPETLSDLGPGSHTFLVRATDVLGNEGPAAQWIWTVGEVAWSRVSAGRGHTCAIREDQTLWCWGLNDRGQVGDGSVENRPVPVRVGDSAGWMAVAAGAYFTCALEEPGRLWCWGANDEGQLGSGTATPDEDVPVPARVGEREDWREVSAGGWHACARGVTHELWCWGYNFSGQVDGEPTSPEGDSRLPPTNVLPEHVWSGFFAGGDHTCALLNGDAWCWGRNDEGQVGDGSEDVSRPLVLVEATHHGLEGQWEEISAADRHTCAIAGGGVYCWGSQEHGQTGLGVVSAEAERIPQDVHHLDEAASLAAGGDHTCALDGAGAVHCWGKNDQGQLGREAGAPQAEAAPAETAGHEASFLVLVAGGAHGCGIEEQGAIYCWGGNSFGQLGDGTFSSRHLRAPLAR